MWETVGWVISSEYRYEVLDHLSSSSPSTPSDISDENDVRIEYVSRSLSELEEENLIEILNPDAHKGRLYSITDRGEETVQKIHREDLI